LVPALKAVFDLESLLVTPSSPGLDSGSCVGGAVMVRRAGQITGCGQAGAWL
jgi:hypothetical protein